MNENHFAAIVVVVLSSDVSVFRVVQYYDLK